MGVMTPLAADSAEFLHHELQLLASLPGAALQAADDFFGIAAKQSIPILFRLVEQYTGDLTAAREFNTCYT